jgi:hypothetical protein
MGGRFQWLLFLFLVETASERSLSADESSRSAVSIFSITSPSNHLLHSTNSQFYPESNKEEGDGGCHRIWLLFRVKTASVSKFWNELSSCPGVASNFPITSPSDSLFASEIAHSMQNQMGKTGMAVANGSYFYWMWKRHLYRFFLLSSCNVQSPQFSHYVTV